MLTLVQIVHREMVLLGVMVTAYGPIISASSPEVRFEIVSKDLCSLNIIISYEND